MLGSLSQYTCSSSTVILTMTDYATYAGGGGIGSSTTSDTDSVSVPVTIGSMYPCRVKEAILGDWCTSLPFI